MTDAEKLRRVRDLLAEWDRHGGCEWGCDDELREALGLGNPDGT